MRMESLLNIISELVMNTNIQIDSEKLDIGQVLNKLVKLDIVTEEEKNLVLGDLK